MAKKDYLINGVPKCTVEGCDRPGHNTGHRRKDGTLYRRKECDAHHALRHNLRGSYRVFKRTVCENTDGRLGFVCTTTVCDPCMLDVDHIDHDSTNNKERNLQTLCSACHNFKTLYFDHLAASTIRKVMNDNRKFFKENPRKRINPKSIEQRRHSRYSSRTPKP